MFIDRVAAWLENIAKDTTDARVEQNKQVQTQILIKFHLQNLDQASNSKSQPNTSLSTKLKLQNLDQISTKIQFHNLYNTSA